MLSRVLASVLFAGLALLAVGALRRTLRGDRAYLQRWIAWMGWYLRRRGGAGRPRALLRMAVPMYVFLAWIGVCFTVGFVLGPERLSVEFAFVAFGVTWVLMVMMLVVRYSGRPRFLVPSPVRGRTDAEVEAWLFAPDERRVDVRRLHRLFGAFVGRLEADDVDAVGLLLRHREHAMATEALAEALTERRVTPTEAERHEMADLARLFGTAGGVRAADGAVPGRVVAPTPTSTRSPPRAHEHEEVSG